MIAEVDRVALRLAVRAERGERRRIRAVADDDARRPRIVSSVPAAMAEAAKPASSARDVRVKKNLRMHRPPDFASREFMAPPAPAKASLW